MKYFSSLPNINITDKSGNIRVYKNIMTRLNIIPEILNNPLAYYSYDLKENDTPEIVAEKYYGDGYRYWILMFSNQLLDPQWDWPMNSVSFQKYILDKYTELGFDPYTTTKSYQKSITQTNLTTGVITTNSVQITEDEYTHFTNYTKTLSFPTESILVEVNKKVQSYYDYEVEKNESKRNIKLLNKMYVAQIESEFEMLVSK